MKEIKKDFKLRILTKGDKLLIVILLIAALAGVIAHISLFQNSTDKYAEISVNGKVVKTFSLQQGLQEEIYIGGNKKNNSEKSNNNENKLGNAIDTNNTRGYNIIEIKDTEVHILKADCPDQICVKSGWISIPPQQIVCLPNQVVIKIISEDNPGLVDGITR